MSLLREAELATWARLASKTTKKDKAAQEESLAKCGEWVRLCNDMEDLAAHYENGVRWKLKGVEKTYEKTWAKALELMKKT